MFYKPPSKIEIPYDDEQEQFDENEHNKDIFIRHLIKKLNKLEDELKKRDELINSLYEQIKKYDENFVAKDRLYENIGNVVKQNKNEEKGAFHSIQSEKKINKNKQPDREKKKYEKQENKENKKVVKVGQVPKIFPMVRYDSPIFEIRKNCFPNSLPKKNFKNRLPYKKNIIQNTPRRGSDDYLDIDSMTYEDLLALEEKIGKVNRGLNETEIKRIDTNKYSKKIYKEQDECPICKEMYQEEEVIKELHCGHIYHTECIERWLELEKKCPCCNTEIIIK